MSLITESDTIEKAVESIDNFIKNSDEHRFIYFTGDNFTLKKEITKRLVSELEKSGTAFRYASTDRMIRDMISNLAGRKPVGEFRSLYLEPQYLILDDIELVGGKESAQEEFYLILKQRFYDDKPTMVITPYPLNEENGFEKRTVALLSEWKQISLCK